MKGNTMLKLLLASLLILVPVAASSESLTPQEYATLYATRVPRDVIATRVLQLYNELPEAAKPQARALLLGDIQDALNQLLGEYQSAFIDPVQTDLTDAGDTTLP
jgi:hypothetical protein